MKIREGICNSKAGLIEMLGLRKTSPHAVVTCGDRDIPENSDVIAGALYDSLEFEAGATIKPLLGFFQEGWGSGKTLAETNVSSKGKLDAPELFVVKGIGVTFSSNTNLDDRNLFAEAFCIDLWVGQKFYFRQPIANLFSVGRGDLANPHEPFRGYADIDACPLVIHNQSSFFGQIVGQPIVISSKMKMWMILYGLHVRGIQ